MQHRLSCKHNQKSFHHTEWMQEIHSEGQSNKAVKDICTSQLEEQKREEEVVCYCWWCQIQVHDVNEQMDFVNIQSSRKCN